MSPASAIRALLLSAILACIKEPGQVVSSQQSLYFKTSGGPAHAKEDETSTALSVPQPSSYVSERTHSPLGFNPIKQFKVKIMQMVL